MLFTQQPATDKILYVIPQTSKGNVQSCFLYLAVITQYVRDTRGLNVTAHAYLFITTLSIHRMFFLQAHQIYGNRHCQQVL